MKKGEEKRRRMDRWEEERRGRNERREKLR